MGALSTVMQFVTAEPPTLNTTPTSAFFALTPMASPISCLYTSACIEAPVAPTGWPFDLSPPDRLTATLSSRVKRPSR